VNNKSAGRWPRALSSRLLEPAADGGLFCLFARVNYSSQQTFTGTAQAAVSRSRRASATPSNFAADCRYCNRDKRVMFSKTGLAGTVSNDNATASRRGKPWRVATQPRQLGSNKKPPDGGGFFQNNHYLAVMFHQR
jgi:hypothetical protein